MKAESDNANTMWVSSAIITLCGDTESAHVLETSGTKIGLDELTYKKERKFTILNQREAHNENKWWEIRAIFHFHPPLLTRWIQNAEKIENEAG